MRYAIKSYPFTGQKAVVNWCLLAFLQNIWQWIAKFKNRKKFENQNSLNNHSKEVKWIETAKALAFSFRHPSFEWSWGLTMKASDLRVGHFSHFSRTKRSFAQIPHRFKNAVSCQRERKTPFQSPRWSRTRSAVKPRTNSRSSNKERILQAQSFDHHSGLGGVIRCGLER